MKVFISWSKQPSGRIAEILRDWLPAVIQRVRPFYSQDDTQKGTRWAQVIAEELRDTEVGIICLTPHNLRSEWLMFEAGALSKLENSHVCPLLFRVGTADLQGPLAQFQATPFDETNMRRVMRTINAALGEDALEPQVLDRVFDRWWPELEGQITATLQEAPKESRPPQRSERDLLEEVLTLVRQLPRQAPTRNLSAEHLMTLLGRFRSLITACEALDVAGPLAGDLAGVAQALNESVRAYGDGLVSHSLRAELRQAYTILAKYYPLDLPEVSSPETIPTVRQLQSKLERFGVDSSRQRNE